MAVYAIGDVQGCYDALRRLLDRLGYDDSRDRLWFAGDLVNRGPQSLQVLRFVKSLSDSVAVLGNHDLHLLAVASGQAPVRKRDTLEEILAAPDRDELLDWLRRRPLLHYDPSLGCAMVHAGLLPQWSIEQARVLADEIEELVARSDRSALFTHMYGDTPDHWDERLSGWARARLIINAFTRLRYCDRDGRLDLRPKMAPGSQPDHLMPWFAVPARRSTGVRIVFGHWSTLGLWRGEGVIGLDSGCVWGGLLTAVRLDGEPEFATVACAAQQTPEK